MNDIMKIVKALEDSGMLLKGVTQSLENEDFKIQRYYQNELRFNGAYSRDNLPNKREDEAYVINIQEYADIGTH